MTPVSSEAVGAVTPLRQRSRCGPRRRDIVGAFGRIRRDGTGAFSGRWRRLRTLMVITGPGLIVMVGDNDAGGVATYAQAGQNYGMGLLWTLALLIPVLYVNQEMVLRLGAVTRVGHARLIFERFGKFWGAFSVGDLLILNALTIVTEFIGVSLALGFLGCPKIDCDPGRCRAAVRRGGRGLVSPLGGADVPADRGERTGHPDGADGASDG